MPLPADYNGSGLSFPLHVQSLRGRGFRTDLGTVVNPTLTQTIRELFPAVPAIVANGISASHVGAAAAGTTSMTLGGSLATAGVATLLPARNVIITVTHGSAVVAMSGVITGTRMGRVITEAWAVTAGTTSKTFTGLRAFDKITSITETVAADASTNTIVAGTGKGLGLTFKASYPLLRGELEGVAIPTAGVLTMAAAAGDARGLYTPNSTLNGTLGFTIWYFSDDLTNIY